VRLPVYSQLTGLTLDDDEHAAGNARAAKAVTTDTTAVSTATDSTEAAADGRNQADDSGAPADTAALARFTEEETETPRGAETKSDKADALRNIPLRKGKANYLFINQSLQLSHPDAQALLQFVARGNDVFVAAKRFNRGRGLLRNSLGFDVEDVELASHKGPKGFPVIDSVEVRFTNHALARNRFRLPGSQVEQRLVVDSGRVGRTLATDAQGRAVLVRLDYGRGHFYLCTAPVAFTNYYMLRPRTTGFAAAALSYLPSRRTWWDEYQKQGPAGEQSLLRVVFAHEALRSAYYLTLVGALLFVLVAARRRQRIIPTIKSLPNTTLLFTRTVAGLYRQGRSHTLIAEKKVSLFLDYLRTRFQETSPDLGDPDFRERLSQKSGVPRPRVDELLRLVNFARTAPLMTDQQLLTLSKALNDFRREASR
jgi:hypothetical protein